MPKVIQIGGRAMVRTQAVWLSLHSLFCVLLGTPRVPRNFSGVMEVDAK